MTDEFPPGDWPLGTQEDAARWPAPFPWDDLDSAWWPDEH